MLAVDATNQSAVDKLFTLKLKMLGKPVSVVMADMDMAGKYVELNKKELVNKLLPGQFTIIAKEIENNLASGVASSEKTLGFRITKNNFLQEIVKKLGRPITATSAQIYGDSLPYSLGFLDNLSKDKKELIDFVEDVGELVKNNLSTLVNLVEDSVLERSELGNKIKEKFISKSVEETGVIARKILNLVGDENVSVLLLVGDLGGGKTTFAKEIGKELGIKENIASPTFNIYNEYEIDWKNYDTFLHFDLYRLSTNQDFENLKFLDLFTTNTFACIEWPEKMSKIDLEILKQRAKVVVVTFEYMDENSRKVEY